MNSAISKRRDAWKKWNSRYKEETLAYIADTDEECIYCPDCKKEVISKSLLRHRTVKAAGCPLINEKVFISNWDVTHFL